MKNSAVLLSEDLYIFLYKNWIERNDSEEELPKKIWMLLKQIGSAQINTRSYKMIISEERYSTENLDKTGKA